MAKTPHTLYLTLPIGSYWVYCWHINFFGWPEAIFPSRVKNKKGHLRSENGPPVWPDMWGNKRGCESSFYISWQSASPEITKYKGVSHRRSEGGPSTAKLNACYNKCRVPPSKGLQVTMAWGHGWRVPKRAGTAHWLKLPWYNPSEPIGSDPSAHTNPYGVKIEKSIRIIGPSLSFARVCFLFLPLFKHRMLWALKAKLWDLESWNLIWECNCIIPGSTLKIKVLGKRSRSPGCIRWS